MQGDWHRLLGAAVVWQDSWLGAVHDQVLRCRSQSESGGVNNQTNGTAGPNILWTVHLMPFYALFVYSGPPRSHGDLGPTARWFVVAHVLSVLIYHFPGLCMGA
jgi:hypothetical protein